MAVSFASATNRRFWWSTFLVSALHIGIAICVGFYFAKSSSDSPWLLAAIVYGGFLLLSLVWWASRQVVGWLVWNVLWRQAGVNDLVASFQKARLPAPDHFLRSATDYFEGVVSNEELEFSVRMAAGAHYLRVAEFAPQQGVIASMRVTKLYEDAIAAFRGTFARGSH